MTPARALREKLSLSIFTDELFGQNCYLVGRRDTASAVVIDPGLQYPVVLDLIERQATKVERILVTHGHVDHVAGIPAVQAATGAPVAMHPDDRAILDWERFAQMPFMPPGFAPFEIKTELPGDGELAFEDLRIRVLHTPGHTEGSVCFLFGLDCFAGDTLFQRSIGRTDLPGGNPEKIIFSIQTVLYKLPPETVVYPGHGGKTTIKSEMLLNPFVPAAS